MTAIRPLAIAVLSAALLLPVYSIAQSDSGDTSLGDLARSLRRKNPSPAQTVIDNDNLSQVMEQVQSQKLASGSMVFSFDKDAKSFEISSPDVTCSLAFTAKATSLLSDPYVPRDMPSNELAKLDGPAAISGDNLQISVYNGSAWSLKEITVGLTFVRSPKNTAASSAKGRLIPAAQTEEVNLGEKRSDVTVLYHLKGSAGPHATTIFREPLDTAIAPDQEWHWAIISAKGIPPLAAAPDATLP
jgi:hypothetical protein